MSHPQASPHGTACSCCPDGSLTCTSSKNHLKSWTGEGPERNRVSEGGTCSEACHKSSTWAPPLPPLLSCGTVSDATSITRSARGLSGGVGGHGVADLRLASTPLKGSAAAPAPAWESADVLSNTTRPDRTTFQGGVPPASSPKRCFQAPPPAPSAAALLTNPLPLCSGMTEGSLMSKEEGRGGGPRVCYEALGSPTL